MVSDSTVQSRRIKLSEAVSDLSRAAGDLSLYGDQPSLIRGLYSLFISSSNHDFWYRILLPCRRSTQHTHTPNVYRHILILHHVPAIHPPEVDRGARFSSALLHHELCSGFFLGVDSYQRINGVRLVHSPED